MQRLPSPIGTLVEFTPDEDEANEHWNQLLDEGAGIIEAADMVEKLFPGLDPEFYTYLRA